MRSQTARSYITIVVATAIVVIAAGAPAGASEGNASVARCPRADNPAVRSENPYVQSLIATGIERSPTFASLVEELEQSDVVAFVEASKEMPSILSGYLVFVTNTNACRYVRIRFAPRFTDVRAIGTIGHELQHAVEIAAHPEVVDNDSLREMYLQYGKRSSLDDSYESAEAMKAGRLVVEELFKSPATAGQR
jgi:hypothetical protein